MTWKPSRPARPDPEAGNWAGQSPYAYNPSYPSPVAFDLLLRASGDPRWAELAAGSRAVTRAVLDRYPLPPDWAQVDSAGTVEATAGAAGHGSDGVRYGYDAARTPLRYAESCSSEDVALAARLTASLSRAPRYAAIRNLDGEASGADESVVAMTGLAAAYAASGDREQSAAGLVAADNLQQQHPTYYGGAWTHSAGYCSRSHLGWLPAGGLSGYSPSADRLGWPEYAARATPSSRLAATAITRQAAESWRWRQAEIQR